MGYIYILTSPSGKSYIGQTTRHIEKRFKEHQKKNSYCVAIYNAVRRYGWENFEKDWYECPDEDLNFDEELLVREMGTLSPIGYNLRDGGANGKSSEETKQRISEALCGEKHPMYGKTLSDEIKQKLRSASIGIPKSEEHKQKIRNSHCGKILSEEHKQKLSEAHLGKKLSDKTKQKMSETRRGQKHHKSKKVYQYDIEGKLIGSFESGREAGRYLHNDGKKISACALDKRKTAYGFKWSYTYLV